MTASIAGRLWPAKTSTSLSQTPGLSAAYMYMSKEPKSPLLRLVSQPSQYLNWTKQPKSPLLWLVSQPSQYLDMTSSSLSPLPLLTIGVAFYMRQLICNLANINTVILLVIGFMHAYLG